jgi:hypothetical protein
MNKNRILVAALAMSLLGLQPIVAADQSKSTMVDRAKKEYREFMQALKCLRREGFRGCSSAQKKRIVAAGVALAAIVVGVGYYFVDPSRVPSNDVDGSDVEEVVGLPEEPSQTESPPHVSVQETIPMVPTTCQQDGGPIAVEVTGRGVSDTIKQKPGLWNRVVGWVMQKLKSSKKRSKKEKRTG